MPRYKKGSRGNGRGTSGIGRGGSRIGRIDRNDGDHYVLDGFDIIENKAQKSFVTIIREDLEEKCKKLQSENGELKSTNEIAFQLVEDYEKSFIMVKDYKILQKKYEQLKIRNEVLQFNNQRSIKMIEDLIEEVKNEKEKNSDKNTLIF